MLSSGFLDGIRVLDLSRLLPGPFLTMALGDLGADVVKVEAPGVGDYMRQMPAAKKDLGGRYLAVNRNKRSLVLDLKSATGRDALLRMVERADVVVETFRPGVMDRLGLGYETLKERNRAVVVCSISGFGQTGPYRDRAGHDLNYIGLAGVLAMGGESRGRKPAMPGVQIADLAGGALWGLSAVLAALVGRGRTGEGAHLDISMTEGSLALLAAEVGNYDAGAPPPTRGAETLNGALACYGVYETSDGKYLSVGALEPKFWAAFNQAIGRTSNLAEVVAPPARQAEIRAEVEAILGTKTRDEWAELLRAHDCCCEPVLELEELAAHPLHAERQMFFSIDDPELGPIQQVRTPLGAPRARQRAPRLGEHAAAILREYGFEDAEITAITGK
ncbi:MAG TPA: CoA transferase [Kofleriaceae bacterium]|nr:CoA transferase [Kofleriaceae bacterium]